MLFTKLKLFLDPIVLGCSHYVLAKRAHPHTELLVGTTVFRRLGSEAATHVVVFLNVALRSVPVLVSGVAILRQVYQCC